MKCPCKGCNDRTLMCHGRCEEYQAWKKENDEKRQWLRDQMPIYSPGALKHANIRRRKIQRGWEKGRPKDYD